MRYRDVGIWADELERGSKMTAFASLAQTLPLWPSEEKNPAYMKYLDLELLK